MSPLDLIFSARCSTSSCSLSSPHEDHPRRDLGKKRRKKRWIQTTKDNDLSCVPELLCRSFYSLSPSLARTLTSAVPLWILNVDIPAHISDDWGVFTQDNGVSGSFTPPRKKGCGSTDDTLLLRLLHMCTCLRACVRLMNVRSANSKVSFSCFCSLMCYKPEMEYWHSKSKSVWCNISGCNKWNSVSSELIVCCRKNNICTWHIWICILPYQRPAGSSYLFTIGLLDESEMNYYCW